MGALPPSLAQKIARGLGVSAYYVWFTRRRVARENFARVLNRPWSDPAVGRVARSSFSNYTLYLLNMLRYQDATPDEFRRRVRFDVAPEANAVMRQARPALIVSAHFGNMDYAAPAAVERYRPVTFAAETIKPVELFEYLARLRSQHGVHLIPYDRAPRKIIEALKRNEFVGFMLDFGINEHKDINTVPVTFFGETTSFPSTPAILAQRYNAPLLVTFVHDGAGEDICFTIDPPLFVSNELPRAEAYQDAMQRVARAFEKAILKHPEQWYVFRPMWPRAANASHSPPLSGHNQDLALP